MLYTNHDQFLSELTKLFESGRQSSKSVWITMKRYDGRQTRNPRKPNDKPKQPKRGASTTPVCQGGDLKPNEYKCLIRAKLGNRKISAAIGQNDMNKFQILYSNLIKGNISGLKKQKSNVSGPTSTSQRDPSTTVTSSKSQSGGGGSKSNKSK